MLPWQPLYIATKIYVLSFFVPRLIHEWGLQNSGPYLKIFNFQEKFPDALFIVYTSTASVYYIPP